ncbi:hypothetical protein P154DRAFT_96573 [Amniculicola lignicola CBS 123094]|uniref:Uncharacterized protein n=1 Tax=Amniculicola lignicola CBS 123094 TaxID=1392246 RepID=A0A6A5VWX1_9PLEO|nr:hypothetical protein P154DRAFT_96573 [Amniculicola lignicola CBS 123094]
MPQRPSRITKARSKLLRPFQQIQSIRKTVRYHKPSASSQGYHRVLRSVADGFELSELARYPATKPPTRALRKPKNGKNDTGPSPLVMVTTSTLPKPIIDDHCQLVNPYSRIMDSSTHSGQALSIVRLGKDTPTAARQPDMVLARVRQEKNCQKSTGYNERRPTNKRVLHQLAAVTAPQRHDSDSDSSSGEDHESDFSDEDNADTRLSPSPGFEQEEQDIWASQPVVNFLELRTRQALTQRWMVAHEV